MDERSPRRTRDERVIAREKERERERKGGGGKEYVIEGSFDFHAESAN